MTTDTGHGQGLDSAGPSLLPLLRHLLLLGLVFFVGLSFSQPAYAARAFTRRFNTFDFANLVQVGNTVVTCPRNITGTGTACTGASQNNSFNMRRVDIDGNSSTITSSSANFSLPSGATVLWAGLYWGAAGDSGGLSWASGFGPAPNAALRNRVFLTTPVAASVTITATTFDTDSYGYSSFADVTPLVRAGGTGTYTVADIQVGENRSNIAAGWSIVIVYQDNTQPFRAISVFDGLINISGTSSQTINISGFTTPLLGPRITDVGVIAYDGDWSSGGDVYGGDVFQLNGTNLRDARGSSSSNDFFNSSISNRGGFISNKNPNYPNQLGIDIDITNADGILANGATSASIRLTSGGETYIPVMVSFATNLFEPTVNFTKSSQLVDNNSDTFIGVGDDLLYTVVFQNDPDSLDNVTNLVLTDPIPNNTCYVPGTLRISTGYNAGPKTDAAGDDQGRFDNNGTGSNCTDDRVIFNLGNGANATAGGTLTPGETTTIQFRVRIQPGTLTGTTILNSAEATFRTVTTGTQSIAFGTSANTLQIGDQIVDLAVTKTDGVTTIAPGDPISYTISVTNNGPATLNRITVLDNLPSAVTTPTFMPSTGTYNPITGLWTGLSLAPGNTITLTITGTVGSSTPGGTILANQVTVFPPSGVSDANPLNNTALDITTVSTTPQLVLVKRITAINGVDVPITPPFFQDLTTGPQAGEDNLPNWPAPSSTYLRGAIAGGQVKSGDTVDFTVYFLNTGDGSATNVAICDLVPDGMDMVIDAFQGATPVDSGGISGADLGIALAYSSSSLPTSPTAYMTSVGDGDRGRYFEPGLTPIPDICTDTNTNGAVVINLIPSSGTLPRATGSGSPPGSYGFIRFRTVVR
ncbi:MAG: hypothetical protein OHK0012_12690 [Synechococcales cyanobacterium]